MNNRALLSSLTELCGVTLRQIADAAGIQVARVREAQNGAPLLDAEQQALSAYGRWLLRDAYGAASKRMRALPGRASDPGPRLRIPQLAEAYQTAFGIDLSTECEVCE